MSPAPRPTPDGVPAATLRDALGRGVISQEQHDLLLAMAAEPVAYEEAPREAPRGFNAVTLAYAVGAAAVLFAFGWFLIDRWRELGPGGVLAVALVYAAIFALTAVALTRQGFATAAGVATVLAVEMAPLVTWALMRLVGLWPSGPRPPLCDVMPVALACDGKWMVVELASIVAALVALRWVRFGELTAPIAVALVFLCYHLAEAVAGAPLRQRALGWAVVAGASAVLTLAYAVDRRRYEGGEDYAFWLYAGGLAALFGGMVNVWGAEPMTRHALPFVGAAALALAVLLRRRTFLLFGGATIVWYLGYLAFDVFRRTLAFPVLLAGVGLAVILGTVQLQRAYPRLTRRAGPRAAGEGARRLRAGYLIFAAPAAIAVAMLPGSLTRDRAALARQRAAELAATRAAARARSDSLGGSMNRPGVPEER
jgi:hypothetical protein